MALRRVQGIWLPLVAFGLAALLPGCANDPSDKFEASKVFDLFTIKKPEEAVLPAEDANLALNRPVGPEDLVDGSGQCAAAAAPAAAAPAPGPAAAAGNAPVDPNAPPDGAPLLGGIALGMSECDVVRRAGQPGNVVISASEKGERLVVLTYLTGTWPGIYHFNSGRLKEIDRAPQPPAPPKPVKKKKPAKPKAKTAAG